MGFNLLREFGLEEEAYQPDQEFGHTIFTRLAYVGVEIDSHIIAYGNWSVVSSRNLLKSLTLKNEHEIARINNFNHLAN